MFIVEENKVLLKKSHILELLDQGKFEDTIQEGLIEFLDVEEEETAMIAMTL